MFKTMCIIWALSISAFGCEQKRVITISPKKPNTFRPKLYSAAKTGDVESVKALISSGIDINTKDSIGSTVLHYAVESGNEDLVTLLIDNGAEVNAKDDWEGATPLYKAVSAGYRRIVQLLLAKGANVNARCDHQATPLHEAVFMCRRNIAKLLIAHGADVNAKNADGYTPLHFAVIGDNLAYIEGFREADNDNFGIEEEFLEKAMIDMMKLLINHGAKVNEKDDLGSTPLHYAMFGVPIGVAEFLLSEGANPNIKNEYGQSMLHEAASDGHLDFVKLFLGHGVDVNAKDIKGQTPLHEAVWENNKEIVEILIANRADINAMDKNGDTPLHVAALNGYTQLYNLLISQGAIATAMNGAGESALDYIRAPVSQKMVLLSNEIKKPYSVIVTKIKNVRKFLWNQQIDIDRIWIPERSDIEGLSSVLQTSLKEGIPVETAPLIDADYILTNLHQYNTEYSGFVREKAKYVICHLVHARSQREVADNDFTTGIYDGGCDFVTVVFEMRSKSIVLMNCAGE